MNAPGLTPAEIDWCADGTPHSRTFDDVYRPRHAAYAQAEHVFLGGNGLPARWSGRGHFTILETGFGLGHNFIATLAAWRVDPRRARRLSFVSIELHPPRVEDLARAHGDAAAELARQWPPPVAGVHLLHLEEGAVRLLLAFGEAGALLPSLTLRADAVFLDGFAPDRNPAMWRERVFGALASKCAPGATAATWSAARVVRDGLQRAGFTVERAAGEGGKREITVARFAPRFPTAATTAAPRSAIVIGAGLAGAGVAAALAREGVETTVLERHATPAADASGNRAAIFHPTVHADDGPHARLLRAGALFTARGIAGRPMLGGAAGLLRLQRAPAGFAALAALADRLRLPASFARALDAEGASAIAGLPLAVPAWFHPQAGWLDPGEWVRTRLHAPGVLLRTGVLAHSLEEDGEGVSALDVRGGILASADVAVAACGDPARLRLPRMPGRSVASLRGQISVGTLPPAAAALRLPIAGDGYAIPLPDGGLLFGATRDHGDPDGAVRDIDHARNLERLAAIAPTLAEAVRAGPLAARVGWRFSTADRLPLAGPLVSPSGTGPSSRVFILAALGSRGASLAPLLAEHVAALILGTASPVERDLAAVVDPSR